MKRDHYDRVVEILPVALALPAEKRAAFLDEACGNDAALRAEVEELLSHAETDEAPFADSSIEEQRADLDEMFDRAEITASEARRPAASGGPSQARRASENHRTAEDSSWIPERIGSYAIERVIGRGGMGVVFEAEQTTPRRRVALKLVDPVLATEKTRERFRQEAEVLGRLQHPGIAQIYEAGSRDLGSGEQLFLAMELIDGREVLDHAHAEHLSTRDRIARLADICDAVEHAHERGIVHRDLKPANILVDREGRPKLLDFGIAHVMEGAAMAATMRTDHGQMMGTLAYMAPEQVRGDTARIGPRADVYSLGCLAFQLLSGRLPHEVAGLTMTSALDLVTETDATRLREVVPVIDRDLDTIVGKALERRTEDRYHSAAALAADLRRFLDHLPIAARPPSIADRTRKFVRRNRALVAGAASVFVVLVGGIIATFLQGLETERARLETRRNLYFAEMLLGTEASMSNGGIERVRELSEHWAKPRGDEDPRGWEWLLLHSIAYRTCLTLGSDEPAMAVSWHPDGDLVAVARTRTVSVYDARSGEEEYRWNASDEYESFYLTGATFSPDGDRVAISGVGVLAVWEPASNTTVWKRDVEFMSRPRWRADGEVIAAFAEKTLHLFDAKNGTPTPGPPGECASLTGFGFDATGTRITVATPGSKPAILDTSTWLPVLEFEAQAAPLGSVLLSPDECRILTTAFDGSVRVFDVYESDSGRLIDTMIPGATYADWHPTGDLVAVGAQDFSVRIYAPTGAVRLQNLQGHRGAVRGIAWSPEGTRLASASVDGDLRVWDLESPAPHQVLSMTHVRVPDHGSVSFGPNGDLVHGTLGPIGSIWHTRGERRMSLPTPAPGGALSRDGRYVAKYQDNHLRIVETETGDLVREFAPGSRGPYEASWHPTDPLIARGNREGLKLFDLRVSGEDGDAGRHLADVKHIMWDIEWSQDGSRLAWAEGQEAIRIIETTGPENRVLCEIPDKVHCNGVAWSPDGNLIALACSDGMLYVHNTSTGDRIASLSGHTNQVVAVAWHPDGSRLASASNDATVKIWDVEHAALAGSFPCGAVVADVAWRPDGRALAAIAFNSRVHIWDASLGYDAQVKRARPQR